MDAYDIVDWRRRVFGLYAEIRADSDPAAAHARWRAGRDELFATHPASPLLPEQHASFTGLPVPDYDPAWRFELKVEQAEPQQIEITSGTDGVVPFDRLGVGVPFVIAALVVISTLLLGFDLESYVPRRPQPAPAR